ncbi:hypothetical protein [Anabaena lutea]|uniref:Transcriptional regulator n=1 Tax=Anabaena lutea FACHB-196 TaxID=2692881 RepID=A0ABR8FIE0_9NOST|nr:hypothetical protein [Anabaena lutea]MBD2569878.1 hypothetical protein [Anabaena lutea FACHB-196]
MKTKPKILELDSPRSPKQNLRNSSSVASHSLSFSNICEEGLTSHFSNLKENIEVSIPGHGKLSPCVLRRKPILIDEQDEKFEQLRSVASDNEGIRHSLHELRKISGLTWEHLAKLFGVSLEKINLWASGEPLPYSDRERFTQLLEVVRYINRGSAGINRNMLLNSFDGETPYELLAIGKFEEVKQLLGNGNAPQKPQLTPLSKDAEASRMPSNPGNLVGALQDTIHRDIGRSWPAKTAKVVGTN